MILHPAKDATPIDAVTGLAVQLSAAPLPGWDAMARVTALVLAVTTFPLASSTETAAGRTRRPRWHRRPAGS